MVDTKRFSVKNLNDEKEVNKVGPLDKKRTNFVVVVASLIVVSLFLVFVGFWWYMTAFGQAAGVGVGELVETFKTGWQSELHAEEGRTNFLLLGLDENGQRNGSMLTDTMVLISVGQEADVKMISIPRDLWIDAFKTKINALYYYGEISTETTGEDLVKTVIEQITGIPIHFSLVTTLDSVSTIIDAVSYIEVDVKQGFVDNKFPRDDVAPDIEPEYLRYETVEFVMGNQKFDGKTALKYIRSRNSENEEVGTDLARSARQREVITALVSRVTSKDIIMNPSMVGALYRLWHNEVTTNLADSDLVSLMKGLINQKEFGFEAFSIPVNNEGEEGLIYHPPVTKYNLWVYEPVDPSWVMMNSWFQTNLYNL
jgi:LCP family protein required for cell wall assembly